MPHATVPDVALNERACFSVGEAAALAGLSVSFLYVLLQRGALRSVKLGGRRLIPRVALERCSLAVNNHKRRRRRHS